MSWSAPGSPRWSGSRSARTAPAWSRTSKPASVVRARARPRSSSAGSCCAAAATSTSPYGQRQHLVLGSHRLAEPGQPGLGRLGRRLDDRVEGVEVEGAVRRALGLLGRRRALGRGLGGGGGRARTSRRPRRPARRPAGWGQRAGRVALGQPAYGVDQRRVDDPRDRAVARAGPEVDAACGAGRPGRGSCSSRPGRRASRPRSRSAGGAAGSPSPSGASPLARAGPAGGRCGPGRRRSRRDRCRSRRARGRRTSRRRGCQRGAGCAGR